MTVTLKGAVQVDREELRAALIAVRGHAGPNKRGDDILPLHRIRLHIDSTFVNVLAASGATMACARAGVLADSRPNPADADDAPYVVDLTPGQIDDVLKVFPARRLRKDAEPREGWIEIAFADGDIVFEDFPDQMPVASKSRLSFTTADPNTEFPNVLALVGRALAEAGATTAAKPLVVGGAVLKLFELAGRAYTKPVRVTGSGDTTSPTYVVEVGSLFLGTFGSRPGDDIAVAQHSTWRTEWLRTLPQPDDDAIADRSLEILLGGVAPETAGDDVPPGQLATDDEDVDQADEDGDDE
jgi:hypothetical protein